MPKVVVSPFAGTSWLSSWETSPFEGLHLYPLEQLPVRSDAGPLELSVLKVDQRIPGFQLLPPCPNDEGLTSVQWIRVELNSRLQARGRHLRELCARRRDRTKIVHEDAEPSAAVLRYLNIRQSGVERMLTQNAGSKDRVGVPDYEAHRAPADRQLGAIGQGGKRGRAPGSACPE